MKVVCINSGSWFDVNAGRHNYGPKYGDIVTVTEFFEDYDGGWYSFAEYPKHPFGKSRPPRYKASKFRPIDNSFGEKVCEYITKECEKIKTPETV